METHKRFESNLWTIPKTEFKFWKVKWVGSGPAHNGSERAGRVPEWQCEPAQGRLTSLFKTWIQLLELLINLIRNASVCSNIILKNLYWSEFGFLVSFWLNFHFFVFSNSTYFESGPAHFQNCLNFWSWKKKFFVEKYFFLRVLWTSKLFWWKVWIL